MLKPSSVSALVVALLLAGCVGGPSQDVSPGPGQDVSFDDATGAIRGFVTSDTLAPLADAVVFALETNQNATTAPDGSFALSKVPPGTHHVIFQKLGYESAQRTVTVDAGSVVDVTVRLVALEVIEPYFETRIQDGLIGCGVLLKQNNDPNSSHNLVAICGVFGNLGYYNIDKFHLAWPMGDLEETSGAWGETAWRPTQVAGKGLSILWTVWDSANTAGGTYSFKRINGVNSPLAVSFTSAFLIDLLEKRPTITNCNIGNCTIHTYHYGRAETLGQPVDVGLALQQRYSEYFTLFYNQELPTSFSALPDQ